MKYGSGKLIQKQICQVAVKKLGYSEAAVARFMGFTTSLVNPYPVSVVTPLRYQAITHKDYHIVARILSKCQRTIIMGKGEHSMNGASRIGPV